MLLIKNANIYAPQPLGIKDILIVLGKIISIEDNIDPPSSETIICDLKGEILTPGLIDQHIHVTGAGGNSGFSSMTPEVNVKDLVNCGTTTVVGLLGTDGTSRNIKSLYSKIKSLEEEGVSAYMFCGYYGVDSVTITEDIQSDMIFIDKIIGCKVAISDIRSSYPTTLELLRKLRAVRTGGAIGNKKGILHVHLGNLKSKLDPLFEIVEVHEFPIEHISPTHVGRTKELFQEAIRFAKMGGMIDITTGASKYAPPHEQVLYALESGVSIDNITFSSDGHAGLTNFNSKGEKNGLRIAPIDKNLDEVIQLIKIGNIPIEEAFKLVTLNPAKNLGLSNKGIISIGCDADFCCFSEMLKLKHVFANGKQLMFDGVVKMKDRFIK